MTLVSEDENRSDLLVNKGTRLCQGWRVSFKFQGSSESGRYAVLKTRHPGKNGRYAVLDLLSPHFRIGPVFPQLCVLIREVALWASEAPILVG